MERWILQSMRFATGNPKKVDVLRNLGGSSKPLSFFEETKITHPKTDSLNLKWWWFGRCFYLYMGPVFSGSLLIFPGVLDLQLATRKKMVNMWMIYISSPSVSYVSWNKTEFLNVLTWFHHMFAGGRAANISTIHPLISCSTFAFDHDF